MNYNSKERNNFVKAIGALTGVALTISMSGCTSLEDFQKMSPESRATKTCNADSTVNHYRYKANSSRDQIHRIETTLLRGYNTKESCTTITYNSDSSDKANIKNGKVRSSSKVICQDVVIPISDYAYEVEKNRITELTNRHHEYSKLRQEAFNSCYDKVVEMSAEKAFNRYDN